MPRSKQEAMKRKKHRGRVRKEAPLPILTFEGEATNDPPCRYFTGYLQGCTVVVQHSGDMDFLYNMGFFGKGNLSRSEPSFDTRQQRVNMPASKKGTDLDGPNLVQAVVTSKRKYFAHLRYKALSDDEESLYNEIVEMERSQLSAYDGEDEEEDEEEEFEEDEEEDSLENTDIYALSRFSFKGGEQNTKLTPEELSIMPRSLLMALMTQVAVLSKEQIATFVRVPCGLAELETKYKLMRKKQVDFLEDIANQSRNPQGQKSSTLSSLLSSLKGNIFQEDDGGGGSSRPSGGDGRGFGKKGIINLEELDNDAVVVLNSDDDDDDDDEKNNTEDRNDKDNAKKSGAKGWDDSDNEGDADFWGMEEDKEKETVDEGKKIESREGAVLPSNSLDDDDGQTQCDVDKELGSHGSELGEKESTEREKDGCHENIDMEKDQGVCIDNSHAKEDSRSDKLQNEDKTDVKEEEGSKSKSSPCVLEISNDKIAKVSDSSSEEVKDDVNCKNIEEEQNSIAESETPSDSHPIPKSSSSPSSTANIAMATETKKDNGSDEDDDVICVEEESAKPAKLHQYLSQPSARSGTGRGIVVKHVTFLGSMAEVPKLIKTRIGFKSWDNVLHFNFTGDPTHLPTGMAVHQEVEDGESPKPDAKSTTSSTAIDADKSSQPGSDSVYERVYPPISSLLASPSSKGSVMKQRHDPLPFLDLALYNLQQRFVPSAPRPPSSKSPNASSSQARTRHNFYSSTPYNSHSRFIQLQSNIWSRNTSHPVMTNQHRAVSTFSQLGNQSPIPSSSSLQPVATVTPSQLQLYLKVFEEETTVESKDTGGEELNQELGNSSEEKGKTNDKMLQKLHVQLCKTGLLKMKTDSNTLDDSLNQVSDDSLGKQSALHIFNRMLSEYMDSQQITLEQELVLLRILMYDERSVRANAIPKELVSDLKSKISPGQVSCLLERMDFVQICVENRRRDLLSSKDVITIDLSDDEEGEEKMDLNDEANDNDVGGDDVQKDSGKNSVLDDEESNLSSDGNKKRSEKKNDSIIDEMTEGKKTDGEEKLEGQNYVNGVGEKRKFDSSSECSEIYESKRLKSGIEEVDDAKNSTTNDIQCKEIRLDSSEDTGITISSSLTCDSTSSGTVEDNPVGCSSVLDKDNNEGSQSKNEKVNNLKGKESERVESSGDGSGCENVGKGDEGLLTVSRDDLNSDIIASKKPGKDSDPQGSNSVGMLGGKESNCEDLSMEVDEISVKNGLDIGDSASNENVKNSHPGKANVTEEPNEIYVGSSDDEDVGEGDDEEAVHGRRAKNFLGNGSSLTHFYCQSDDEGGDHFVIANTSDGEEEEDDEDDDVMVMNAVGPGLVGKRNMWRPCLKRDPYQSEEKLHLMLEEAFFLTFGLGCLRVMDQEMNPMTISAMWQRFMVIQEKFIPRYVAYHYFRSKGWVPKSGLKFGCDFTLYREGPPFYHGSYSVVVVPVKAGTLAHMDGEDGELDFSRRWTSWIALSGLNRVTEHVAKELMICYVIFPKGLSEEDSKSPKCLTQFTVKEVAVSRWVSAREREGKDQLEEIP